MEKLPNNRITRRALLTGAPLAVAGAALVLSWARSGTRLEFIRNIVTRRADYLQITDDDLTKFAKAYHIKWRWKVDMVWREIWSLRFYGSPLYTMLTPGEHEETMDALERDVVTRLLLATDFFEPGKKQDEVVAYYGIEEGGCRNPFARFD